MNAPVASADSMEARQARADEAPSTNDRFFIVSFIGLALVNALPFTAKYLPFTDLQGHMGLVGALLHWNDPPANIQALYTINPHRFLPCAIFEYFGLVFGRVVGVPVATNLYLAASCVIGLPLSMMCLLRAYDRDVRLSLVLFPIVFYRCVWFGFANFTAAVPLALLALALLRRLIDARDVRSIVRRTVGLAALCLSLAIAHFFPACLFLGWCALTLMLERPRVGLLHLVSVVASLVPTLVFLGLWLRHGTGDRVDGELLEAFRTADRGPMHLAQLFYEWHIHGIATSVSDWVMAGFAISLLGSAVYGVLRRRQDLLARRYWQPLALFVTAALLFVILPEYIPSWWAINVRMVPFIWAFALLAIPRGRDATPAWILAPAIAAGAVWGGYLTQDFHRWFNGVEMTGFDQAIDSIPPGKLVQTLWPDFESERHYTHFPLADIGAQYVVRHGGLVEPMLDGNTNEFLIRPIHEPEGPSWGMLPEFDYAAHRREWDYFLLKLPSTGSVAPPLDPLAPLDRRAVTKVAEHGLWRVYRNRFRS